MRQSPYPSSPALSFRLSAGVVRKINDYIRNNMQMLLTVPVIREMVVRDRLAKLRPGDIRRFESHDDAMLKDTVRYNVEQLHAAAALGGPSQLIDPLSCIDYVRVHRKFLKVLTVGPRTEAEIIALVMAGFALGQFEEKTFEIKAGEAIVFQSVNIMHKRALPKQCPRATPSHWRCCPARCNG